MSLPPVPRKPNRVFAFLGKANFLRHIDLFGNPVFYDLSGKISKRSISYSSQLLALIIVLQKIDISEILEKMETAKLWFQFYDRGVEYAKILAMVVFSAGWTLKMLTRILEFATGGTWVPYSRVIRKEEFNTVYDVYAEIFKGQELMPRKTAFYLAKENLLQLHIVFKEHYTGDRDRKLSGFFVINLLSDKGFENVITGEKDGRHFDSGDLAADIKDARAVYIGAMGGRTMHDKACVMTELLRHIRDLPDLPLLARPSTPDGKRIAAKYGWHPIEGISKGKFLEVWQGTRAID